MGSSRMASGRFCWMPSSTCWSLVKTWGQKGAAAPSETASSVPRPRPSCSSRLLICRAERVSLPPSATATSVWPDTASESTAMELNIQSWYST
jgi:hypothetical protein